MSADAPIPELKRHLRAIKDGNRIDAVWMCEERFDNLVMLCDIVASHSISAREAAFRRDQSLLEKHLRSARDGLRLAVDVFKLLPAETGEKGRPA